MKLPWNCGLPCACQFCFRKCGGLKREYNFVPSPCVYVIGLYIYIYIYKLRSSLYKYWLNLKNRNTFVGGEVFIRKLREGNILTPDLCTFLEKRRSALAGFTEPRKTPTWACYFNTRQSRGEGFRMSERNAYNNEWIQYSWLLNVSVISLTSFILLRG